MVFIRKITLEDATSFVDLNEQIDLETDFMLFEPGDRQITSEQQRKRIESIDNEENSTILVASYGEKLVGYLAVIGGHAKRNKHSAYLVIGILKEYRGQGIGTKLFEYLEKWAIDHNIRRLELTVMKHNTAGVALFKKMGFEAEGTKRRSLIVNGKFVDEFYMSKLF